MQQDTSSTSETRFQDAFQASASNESRDSSMPQKEPFLPLDTTPINQPSHSKHESLTSDEFGSFVSVSAADDPLGAGLPSLGPASPSTTASTFNAFVDDARERTEKNERRILDELRTHEEDPLAWLSSGSKAGLNDASERNTLQTDNSGHDSEDVEEGSSSVVDALRIADTIESKRGITNRSTALEETNEAPDASEIGHTSEDLKATSIPHSLSADPLDNPPSRSETSSTPSHQSAISSRSERSLGIELTAAFGEGPKERAERNEKRVLDELRAHDDDPLGWLKSKTDDDDSVSSALREAGSTLIDLSTPASKVPPPPPTRSPIPSSSTSIFTSTSPQPPSLPRTTSSPSITRSPDHTRSQSPPARVPKSPSIGSSLSPSRSWMSSLGLFSAPRAVPASSSPSAARGTHEAPTDAGSAGLSPTQSSLHALFARAGPSSPPTRRHSRFAMEGHSPLHAATMPLPTAPAATSDVSPFASHVYVPPSGAPGFAGDHNWNPDGFEFDPRRKADWKSVRLVGRKEFTTPVLDSALATALRAHLPPLARLTQSWTLLYSADQHGLSLNTLYARCAPPVIAGGGGLVQGASTGALVALQDAEGGVFGAWVPEGVHLSHGSYYGGGDSFLWSVNGEGKDGKELHVYKWTGRNGYVAFCDTDGFSFGGGEGHYGLYVDANLVEGTTHPCPTFENECLAHGERRGRMVAFDAVGLEVWSVGS